MLVCLVYSTRYMLLYHNTETIDRCVTSVILLRCDVLPANPGSLIHFFDTSETPCCRPSTHPDSSSSREMVSTHSLRNTAKSQTPESSIHRLPSNKIESCGSSKALLLPARHLQTSHVPAWVRAVFSVHLPIIRRLFCG